MSERDRQRGRDRERERERDRDRDRDRERRRDKEDRERDRDPERTRSKRSRSRTRTPDRSRSRHTRSRTRSPDHRSHRRTHQHHRGSLSPSPPAKRHRRDHDDEKAVEDFVDGIAKEQLEKKENNSGGFGEGIEGGGDEDEIERMEKLGIPVRFDSTKGKPVPGADVSGVRAVTKRQPRQYMNRRGGFNRPLEAERNR